MVGDDGGWWQAIRVRFLMRGELEDKFVPDEIACRVWTKARGEIEEEGVSLIEKLNEVQSTLPSRPESLPRTLGTGSRIARPVSRPLLQCRNCADKGLTHTGLSAQYSPLHRTRLPTNTTHPGARVASSVLLAGALMREGRRGRVWASMC